MIVTPLTNSEQDGSFWATGLRLVRRTFGSMPRRSSLIVLLALLNSLLQGASLVLLVPLVGSLGVGSSSETSIARGLRTAFAALGVPYTLGTILGLVFGVSLSAGMVALVQGWISYSTYRHFVSELQVEAYRTLSRCRLSYLSRQRLGDTITNLTKFTEQAGGAFFLLIQLLTTAVIVAGLVLVALSQAWQFVLATFGVLSVAVLPMRWNSRAVHRLVRSCHGAVLAAGATITEHLRLLSMVKAFGAEGQSLKMVEARVAQAEMLWVQFKRRIEAVRVIWDVAMVGLLCLAIYAGVAVFSVTLDRLLVLVGIFMRIVAAIRSVLTRTEQLPMLLAAFDGVTELLNSARAAAEPKGGLPAPMALHAGIAVQKLKVADGNQVLVDDVSLVIRPRSITALVGPSGSGKSTIANAVLGLVEAAGGRIEIEGVELARMDREAWRKRIGYVGQDIPLWNCSIRDNLLFAAPEVDEAQVYRALDEAGVGEFVRRLPKGLDTVVGEQGSLISGGERQRIAIARALLRKPLLLILDEPTSALDAETARKVVENIEALRQTAAILIIAHDLNVVRNADTIYVVQHGKILEHGTWRDLIEGGGKLSELAFIQQRAL